MSTKSACAASCCSPGNSVKKSDFSNKKEKKQERKSYLDGFSNLNKVFIIRNKPHIRGVFFVC